MVECPKDVCASTRRYFFFSDILKKAFEKAASKTSGPKIRLESSISMATFLPCALYRTALQTLTELRMDILGGKLYMHMYVMFFYLLCSLFRSHTHAQACTYTLVSTCMQLETFCELYLQTRNGIQF